MNFSNQMTETSELIEMQGSTEKLKYLEINVNNLYKVLTVGSYNIHPHKF